MPDKMLVFEDMLCFWPSQWMFAPVQSILLMFLPFFHYIKAPDASIRFLVMLRVKWHVGMQYIIAMLHLFNQNRCLCCASINSKTHVLCLGLWVYMLQFTQIQRSKGIIYKGSRVKIRFCTILVLQYCLNALHLFPLQSYILQVHWRTLKVSNLAINNNLYIGNLLSLVSTDENPPLAFTI